MLLAFRGGADRAGLAASHRVPVWVFCLFCWGLAAYPAQALPFFKPFLPDFYQHQKAGPTVNVPNDADVDFGNAAPQPPNNQIPSYAMTPDWWEDGGGWCCITAFVNSFYFLEKRYDWNGLFTRPDGAGKTWQEQMVYAIEDMAIEVFGLEGNAPVPIPKYVRDLENEAAAGAKSRHLTISQYTLDSGKVMKQDADAAGDLLPETDVSGQFASLFDAYRVELCKSQDVTVRWEYPGGVVPPGEAEPWWAPSFHATTGAGVADCKNSTDRTLWFADPDKRNADEAGTYLPVDIREPYPNDANLPVPIGELHYEMVTLDANDCIASGIYKGACMVLVTDISVVPEPPTWVLLLAGLAGLMGFGYKLTGREMG
ncbi:MAG: PEP-CTERM sorting domain-containing protein [Alphaproteobacteria bacterium]